MQDAGSFFGAGGLIAKPPKRIVPANRGAGNVHFYRNSGQQVLSRAAANSHLNWGLTNGGAASISLVNTSNGNTIATILANHGSWGSGPSLMRSSLVYDWVNGFYYVISKDSTQAKLLKINDTTGAVTAMSTITLATSANWYDLGHSWVSGGNLKFLSVNPGANAAAYLHTISLADGSIVSQNQTFALSDGTQVPFLGGTSTSWNASFYVTADESSAICFSLPSNAVSTTSAQEGTSNISIGFAKGGVCAVGMRSFIIPNDFTGIHAYSRFVNTADGVNVFGFLNTNVYQSGWPIFDRADFDRYVKAIIKAAAGV